jgi:hypothetical protein
MRPSSQRIIVINGVRYNVAIRLDTNWSYIAEWWNDREYHKHTLDETIRSAPHAEREAIDQIHNAHLNQEPWLHVEMA